MDNLEYWLNKSGVEYRATQNARALNNNVSYRVQESWFRDFFEQRAKARANAPIKVLDFGCGFGRIARLLCDIEGLDYYGYDISPAMAEELRASPPKPLAGIIQQRLRTAESLDSAYPDQKFDFILTVSVLIHNSQENVQRVLSSMLDHLAPDGKLVLLENQHTAVSSFENFWHGGCWCHAFARYLNGRADVEIFDNLADRHGFYVVAPHQYPRESQFVFHANPQAEGEELEFESVLLRGLNKATINADHLASELAEFGKESGALIGRIHDLSERLSYAEGATSRLKLELAAAKARFSERQRLMEDLASVLNDERDRAGREADAEHFGAGHSRSAETVEWNARRDVIYSHTRSGFEKVLHIFQQEWFGIRAAAGSLPGHKLAISADIQLTHKQLIAIYERIERDSFSRIVFHGLSENTSRLAELLAKRGLSELIYMIKHGSQVQWFADEDRRMAFKTIELLRSKKIRKLQFIKPGFDYPLQGVFRPLLFNLSPSFDETGGLQGARALPLDGVVLAPGWPAWTKNLYTNVLGAALSSHVHSIWLHAQGVELPAPLSNKLALKKYATREETFQLMAMSSLCLNVSLADCHPMINIEAQSLGRPCLRRRLFLDALEDHPYVALTTVNDESSIAEVRERVDAVLAMPPDEREGLTHDYQRQSDAVAFARYAEFLEL